MLRATQRVSWDLNPGSRFQSSYATTAPLRLSLQEPAPMCPSSPTSTALPGLVTSPPPPTCSHTSPTPQGSRAEFSKGITLSLKILQELLGESTPHGKQGLFPAFPLFLPLLSQLSFSLSPHTVRLPTSSSSHFSNHSNFHNTAHETLLPGSLSGVTHLGSDPSHGSSPCHTELQVESTACTLSVVSSPRHKHSVPHTLVFLSTGSGMDRLPASVRWRHKWTGPWAATGSIWTWIRFLTLCP